MNTRVLILIPAALGLWFAFTGNTTPLRISIGAASGLAAANALGLL